MLGEIVEVRFEKKAGDPLKSGDILGSIEGFKAISDIYCCADGAFAGANDSLQTAIEKVGDDPYGAGWLYEFDGQPDAKCIPLAEYRGLLDATIDRILAKQQSEES
jgi:glycine cleavage system H protein